MLTTKEFQTSDGTKYKITVFDGEKSLEWMTRILAILGPAFGTGIEASLGAKDAAQAEAMFDLAGAISQVAGRLTPTEVKLLARDLADNAFVCEDRAGGIVEVPLKGKAYNDHFAGAALRQLDFIRLALEANYQDVFTSLRQHTGPLIKKVPEKPQAR